MFYIALEENWGLHQGYGSCFVCGGARLGDTMKIERLSGMLLLNKPMCQWSVCVTIAMTVESLRIALFL